MKLEKDDAKIGLLVFLTLALFVGFIFHRSLATILRKVTLVKVHLDSAAEVAVGTEVQLQGLRVGQVEAIELQRKGVQYQFLAILGLRTDIVLWEGTRVVVVAKPLGGAFMDLQLPPPAQRREQLGAESILPGTSGSSLTSLVEDIATLVQNLNRGVDELRGQLQQRGLGAVLDQPKVSRVFLGLDATLRSFQQLAQDGRGLARQGSGSLKAMDKTLATLDQCSTQIHTLLTNREGDLDAIVVHLSGALGELEGLSRELRTVVQDAGPDGEQSLKSLDRTLRSTEELIELLKTKPNRVVWGKPTQAEQEAAAARVEAARKAQGAKP